MLTCFVLFPPYSFRGNKIGNKRYLFISYSVHPRFIKTMMRSSIIRTLFLLTIALFLALQSHAQHKTCGHQIYSPKTTELDFHPCGTADYTSDWHRAYRKNPTRFQKNVSSRSTTYVPITLHLVGKSDSTGFGKLSAVLNAFCQLNKDYKQTGLQFYINFPIRYIANSSFMEHNSTYGQLPF